MASSNIYNNDTNVGIGTTAPSANLHVNGTTRLQGLSSSTQSTILTVDANGNIYTRASGEWTGGPNYWTDVTTYIHCNTISTGSAYIYDNFNQENGSMLYLAGYSYSPSNVALIKAVKTGGSLTYNGHSAIYGSSDNYSSSYLGMSYLNRGVLGYHTGGNAYTAGVAGYRYDGGYGPSAGVFGAVSTDQNPAAWGALGFQDASLAEWGGYFTGNGYFSNNVGIGTTTLTSGKLSIIHSAYTTGIWISNPGHGIEVSGMGGGYDAIRASGNTYGVYATGNTAGVYGADGSYYGYLGYGSYGVYGYGSYGVYGTNTSSYYGYLGYSSYGVYGYGYYGVYGSSSSGPYGYLGYGSTAGVYGYSYYDGNSAWGIYGYRSHSSATYNGNAGVYGYLGSTSAAAYYGNSYNEAGVKGIVYWGDEYHFGVSGTRYDDSYTRTGGVIGMISTAQTPPNWGSLGYKNSDSDYFGAYWTNAPGTFTGGGSGRRRPGDETEIYKGVVLGGFGCGSYSEFMSGWFNGEVYGIHLRGARYAQYNDGDNYSNGVEGFLQDTGGEKRAIAYTNVSTDVSVNSSGVGNLRSGRARVEFDQAFSQMASGEIPIVVAVSPMGNSKGVYVAEVDKTGFTIVENDGGNSDVQFSWIAMARRAGYETRPEPPVEILAKDFDANWEKVMFNENDLENTAGSVHWNGSELSFTKRPATQSEIEAREVKAKFTADPMSLNDDEWRMIGMSREQYIEMQRNGADQIEHNTRHEEERRAHEATRAEIKPIKSDAAEVQAPSLGEDVLPASKTSEVSDNREAIK